jgi:archaellum component FlaF (FlaF/FlaG flagellin family)
VTVGVSPAGVASAAAAIVSACAVFTQFACAEYGSANRDVPKAKKNTASKLLLLAKEEIDLVNAFFQSVHLVFHGTAPVWL